SSSPDSSRGSAIIAAARALGKTRRAGSRKAQIRAAPRAGRPPRPSSGTLARRAAGPPRRRRRGESNGMRIVSWNVNGLRACAKKGFLRFLAESGADVVAVQEVRAAPAQLEPATREPPGWHTCFAPAERPGYSGVAIYSRVQPDAVEIGLGERRFDCEGRLILARFGRTYVVNGYFPKGSGKNRDNSRVPYKLDFYRAVFD